MMIDKDLSWQLNKGSDVIINRIGKNDIMRLVKVVACALASHPDPFTVLVQQDRNRHECAGEESEKRARPSNPKVAICRPGEQRECRAEHRTNKVVSS